MSRLVKDLIDVFEKGKAVDDTVLLWLLNFYAKQVIVCTLDNEMLNLRNKPKAKSLFRYPLRFH